MIVYNERQIKKSPQQIEIIKMSSLKTIYIAPILLVTCPVKKKKFTRRIVIYSFGVCFVRFFVCLIFFLLKQKPKKGDGVVLGKNIININHTLIDGVV